MGKSASHSFLNFLDLHLFFAITTSYHYYFVPATSWLFIVITVFFRTFEDFFAFFPHSDRTTRPLTPCMLGKRIFHWGKYARYESEAHKRQKYKLVISIVVKLRQVITETNCTQGRESEIKTFDIMTIPCVSREPREPLMVVEKSQIPKSLSTQLLAPR